MRHPLERPQRSARSRLAVLVAVAVLIGSAALPALASIATVDIERGAYRGDNDTWYYTPEEVRVPAGSSVTFRNPAHHGLRGSADDHPTSCVRETRRGRTKGDCPFGTFQLPPGAQHTVSFPEDGTFQYVCALHAWMVGTVIVGSGEPPAPEPEPEPAPKKTAPASSDQPRQSSEQGGAASAPAPEETVEEEPAPEPTPEEEGVDEDEAEEEPEPTPDPTPTAERDTEMFDEALVLDEGGARDQPGLVAVAVMLLLATAGANHLVRSRYGW